MPSLIGMLLGDLSTDDNARFAFIAWLKEAPGAIFLECPWKDRASQILVRDNVLPGDHGLVEDRTHSLAGQDALKQHATPLDDGGEAPDLRSDRTDTRHLPKFIG